MVIGKQMSTPEYQAYDLPDYQEQITDILGLNTVEQFEAEVAAAGFAVDKKQVIVSEKDKWGNQAFRVELVIGTHALVLRCSPATPFSIVSVDFTYASVFESNPNDMINYYATAQDVEGASHQGEISRRGLIVIGTAISNICRNILMNSDSYVIVQATTNRKKKLYAKVFEPLLQEVGESGDDLLQSRLQTDFVIYDENGMLIEA
jgi:hypothetical protein